MNERLLQDCLEELSNGGFPLTGGGENAILGGMKDNDKKTLAETIADEMRAEEGELLMEMANIHKMNYRGMPANMWFFEAFPRHTPRVKIQRDHQNQMNKKNTFSMTISQNPEICAGDSGELDAKDVAWFVSFIQRNYDVLMGHWNGTIDSIHAGQMLVFE